MSSFRFAHVLQACLKAARVWRDSMLEDNAMLSSSFVAGFKSKLKHGQSPKT